MQAERPTLYLAIEDTDRELDARLMIAAEAVAHGFRVVIGQQWQIFDNLDALVPGIVLFKGMDKVQAHAMKLIHSVGHRLVVIDEEAMGVADARLMLKGIDREVVPLLDRFLVQGANQLETIASAVPELAGRLAKTGNPRIDMLGPRYRHRFEDEARRLRGAYGRFLLVNTSFGFVNSGLGTPSDYLAMCKRIGRGDWDNPEDQAYFRARFDFENHNIHAFRDMLPAMAERFPEHRIILRPHPSENGDVWVEAFSDHKRVEVLREGSTIPWILASEFLIHQTCTTGAEAHLLEHPVGAYSPITNAAESVHIGNLVTPVHRSLESLFGAIEAAVADPADAVARMQADCGAALDHHFFRSSETSAAARIAAELQALGAPRSGSVMRAADRRIIPRDLSAYERRKFTLDTDHLTDRFAHTVAQRTSPIGGEIVALAEDVFQISPTGGTDVASPVDDGHQSQERTA